MEQKMNKKNIDKWMSKNITGFIILIAILYFMIGFMVSDIMDEEGYTVAFSTGNSMCPEIGFLSIAFERTKDFDVNEGDVVVYTFESEEKIHHIQHRVVDIEDNYYEIKGDNIIGDWSHLVDEKDIESKLIYSLDLVKCNWREYVGLNI